MGIQVEQLFGTELVGSVEDINNEPEHRRAGIRWSLIGDFLDIEDGPRPGANLATHWVIAEEVARHVSRCGVNMTFRLPTGTHLYEVRPGKAKKVKRFV